MRFIAVVLVLVSLLVVGVANYRMGHKAGFDEGYAEAVVDTHDVYIDGRIERVEDITVSTTGDITLMDATMELTEIVTD